MSRKNTSSNGIKVDPNAWMATLSDLVFLLITFFVLLITMSSLDAKRVQKAFGFFNDAVGVMQFPENAATSSDEIISKLSPLAEFNTHTGIEESVTETSQKNAKQAAKRVLESIVESLTNKTPSKDLHQTLSPLIKTASGTVVVEKTKEGIAIVLQSKLLFTNGDDKINEEGFALLSDIAAILNLWDSEVNIVASWSWHDAPNVLNQVLNILENDNGPSKSLHPIISPNSDRTIRFVLKKKE